MKKLVLLIVMCSVIATASAALQVHLPFSGDFENVAGTTATATLIDEPEGAINFVQTTRGLVADFVNPDAVSGKGDSLDLGTLLGPSGTIVIQMLVERNWNYQGIFDNSINAGDWESWIYGSSDITWRIKSTRTNSYKLTDHDLMDTWFQYAVTWGQWDDNGTTKAEIRLWINGEMVGKKDNTWVNPGIFYLGCKNPYNDRFDGSMDEFRMYDTEFGFPECTAIGDFCPELIALIPLAETPSPADGQSYLASEAQTLTWTVDPAVTTVDPNVTEWSLYFDSDPTFPSGAVLTSTASPQWTTPVLASDTKYYWRVDYIDVYDTNDLVHTGATWSFDTICRPSDTDCNGEVNFEDFALVASHWQENNIIPAHSLVLEDFEYADQAAMEANWAVEESAISNLWQPVDANFVPFEEQIADGSISLITDPNDAANQVMSFAYDMSHTHDQTNGHFFAAYGAFDGIDVANDWDSFSIRVKTTATNSNENMYIKWVDSALTGEVMRSGETQTGETNNPAEIPLDTWTTVTLPFSVLDFPSWNETPYDAVSDMTNTCGVELPVVDLTEGSPDTNQGVVLYDDLMVHVGDRCSGPQSGDLNDDCYVNIADLQIIAQDWLK